MEFSTKGYSRVEQILLWTARLALLILLPFLFINYDEFKHYYFPIALVFFGTQIVADANNCLSFDFTVGQKEVKKINFKFSALSTIPKISINGIRVNIKEIPDLSKHHTYEFTAGHLELNHIVITKVRLSMYSGKYAFEIVIDGVPLTPDRANSK